MKREKRSRKEMKKETEIDNLVEMEGVGPSSA